MRVCAQSPEHHDDAYTTVGYFAGYSVARAFLRLVKVSTAITSRQAIFQLNQFAEKAMFDPPE